MKKLLLILGLFFCSTLNSAMETVAYTMSSQLKEKSEAESTEDKK